MRGQGYGYRVWRAAIEPSGDRVIGLDGVPAQQANYARSGFRLAWRTTRYQAQGGGEMPPDLIDLDTLPFAAIAAYDADVFEADRHSFLRAWIAQAGARRFGMVRNGRLAGWGLIRACDEGCKIGPLMADDAGIAAQLLDGLRAAADGPVSLDVPEPNAEAMRLVESRGMTPCSETARMNRGDAPPIGIGKVLGVTSFELG